MSGYGLLLVGGLAAVFYDLRERLERSAREQSAAGFSNFLVQTAAPIKGRAILQHKTEYSGPDRVRLVVDRVYENRPWVLQAYRLRRGSETWKV